jgi:hypothetical protein
MYFADMTPYTYHPLDAATDASNVGWLSNDHPFSVGSCPQGLLERLFELLKSNRFHPTRGRYLCDFCPPPRSPVDALRNGEKIPLGFFELKVVGPTGHEFIAPSLIYHYVEMHSYLPPEPFIEAVLHGHC